MVWKTAAAMMRMKRRRVSRGSSHLQLRSGHHRLGKGATKLYTSSLAHFITYINDLPPLPTPQEIPSAPHSVLSPPASR